MCEYCDKKDSEIMQGNQYNILGRTFLTGVYVGEGSRDLIVEFGDERIFQGKINYCPMCGRKLNTD